MVDSNTSTAANDKQQLIKQASTLPDWHDDEEDDYDEEDDTGVEFGDTPTGSKPVTAQNSMVSAASNKDS